MKFYDAKLHGMDWDQVVADYRRYLPYVQHWEELAEILSEMVDELNASHQGSHCAPDSSDRDATASLGVYLDESWRGAGVYALEVLAGGPADRSRSMLKPRAVILAVAGQSITPETELAQLLNRKASQPVLVSVQPAQGGDPVEETATPVSLMDEAMLAYQRWVDKRLDYGVPQLGFRGRDGRFFENQEIVPDVPLAAEPAALAAGRDPQLERTVEVVLQQIGAARCER